MKKTCKKCAYYKAHKFNLSREEGIPFHRVVECAVAPSKDGPICGGFKKKKMFDIFD